MAAQGVDAVSFEVIQLHITYPASRPTTIEDLVASFVILLCHIHVFMAYLYRVTLNCRFHCLK